jgi:hypothetical protein
MALTPSNLPSLDAFQGAVHSLRGSEPCKYVRLWGLDGPHTLDTLEGFIRPEPAAHQQPAFRAKKRGEHRG